MVQAGADGRQVRAARQRMERRRQILDAALRLFAARGYPATGISDIVEAAAVARGTFYLYFPSKRAVFDALLDELTQEIEQGIHRVELGAGAPPVPEQLHRNVVYLLSLARARPEMLQILLWETVGRDEELDRKLGSFHQRMYELTERSLRLGMAARLVRPGDPQLRARCVVGAIKEVLLSLLVDRELEPDLERLAAELLDFHTQGLLAWRPASALQPIHQ